VRWWGVASLWTLMDPWGAETERARKYCQAAAEKRDEVESIRDAMRANQLARGRLMKNLYMKCSSLQ